jgi:hypothetical protein
MSKNRKPNACSEQAAIAYILTRDIKFAREASWYTDLKLHLKLAARAAEEQRSDTEYNLVGARDALYVKVAQGLIRKVEVAFSVEDFSVEDLVRQFPPLEQAPASLAQVQDHVAAAVPDALMNSLADATNRSAVKVGTSGPEVNPRPRRMTEKSAITFTEQYLEDMRAKGLRPTKQALEKAAYDEGFYGGRQFLRDELSKRLGVDAPGPGRPREKRNSPK